MPTSNPIGNKPVMVTYLRSIMVEYNSIEISTVVVLDEIFSGVGSLQAARSKAFMLKQCLVQSKQHLKVNTDHLGENILSLE